MIWFYFLVGILVGGLLATVGLLISMFKTFKEHLIELEGMYDCGFEHGRDWKNYELEWARSELKELRNLVKEHEEKI